MMRGVAEVLDGEGGASGQRAFLRDYGDRGFLADGVEAHAADGEGSDHEEGVDFAIGEAGDLLLGGELADFELEVGVLRGEGADDGGEQDELANGAAADAEAQASVQVAEAFAGGVDGVDDGLGVLAEGEAGVGEADAAGGRARRV